MATYTSIDLLEIDQLLRQYGFQPLPQLRAEGVKEEVYGKRVAPDLTIRVYTSIEMGTSRPVGEDAIRVCLVQKRPDGTITGVGRQRRVHRVENWRKNLTARLLNWKHLLGDPCPACKGYTVERRSKHGLFLGCANYPACRGTLPLQN